MSKSPVYMCHPTDSKIIILLNCQLVGESELDMTFVLNDGVTRTTVPKSNMMNQHRHLHILRLMGSVDTDDILGATFQVAVSNGRIKLMKEVH